MFRSLTLTGEQIRAARALGRLEQAELARRSGLSLETIKRLERIRGPVDANSRTLNAISEAFQLMGIQFESGEGVGVRLLEPVAAPAIPIRSGAAAPRSASGQLHRLIYHSAVRPEASVRMRDLLEDILQSSRRRNESLGVTGVLFACQGRFLQVLEGEKHAVQQVYGAISADPRHGALQVVESRAVVSRQFPDWTFCCGLFPVDREMFGVEPALQDGFRPEVLTPASALGLLSVVKDVQQTAPRVSRGSPSACPLAAECLDRECSVSYGEDRRSALPDCA
ncbi:BLUF domain-containing protein [Phenylobacterium soli]|uniref:BLUF domain-containing protein n=1 Tax=Phenylobacterium soli TaxID=2170551 RepID=UPI0018746350|nr:BLUF domain-containing protein [Phenylobacterium soli]